MNDYTDYEKNIIISLLIQIMEADNIIHPLEQQYLEKVVKQIAFNPLNYCATDLHTCAICVNSMTPNKKEEVQKLLLGMAEADGDYDPREKSVIEQIFNV